MDTLVNVQLSTSDLYQMYRSVMDELDAEWNDESCATYRNIVRILAYSAINHVNITNAALSLGLVHPWLYDDYEE